MLCVRVRKEQFGSHDVRLLVRACVLRDVTPEPSDACTMFADCTLPASSFLWDGPEARSLGEEDLAAAELQMVTVDTPGCVSDQNMPTREATQSTLGVPVPGVLGSSCGDPRVCVGRVEVRRVANPPLYGGSGQQTHQFQERLIYRGFTQQQMRHRHIASMKEVTVMT